MAFIVHNAQRDYHLSSTYTHRKEGRWGFHICEHQWRVKRLMILNCLCIVNFSRVAFIMGEQQNGKFSQ